MCVCMSWCTYPVLIPLAVAHKHLTVGALSDLVGHIKGVALADRARATILWQMRITVFVRTSWRYLLEQ
jgi:hypothetical protein